MVREDFNAFLREYEAERWQNAKKRDDWDMAMEYHFHEKTGTLTKYCHYSGGQLVQQVSYFLQDNGTFITTVEQGCTEGKWKIRNPKQELNLARLFTPPAPPAWYSTQPLFAMSKRSSLRPRDDFFGALPPTHT